MKKTFFVIFFSATVALVLNIFFGGLFTAKLSTVKLFGRYRILNPQAPIVINTREEIRSNDKQDTRVSLEKVKPKLSLLVIRESGFVRVLGGAINLTSDGVLVSTQSVITLAKNAAIFAVLNDGRLAMVTSQVLDPATGLIFLKIPLADVPVADFGASGDVLPSDKLLFVNSSLFPYAVKFRTTFASVSQKDVQGMIFDSDHPSRKFQVQQNFADVLTMAVVNLSGEILGIADGSNMVASDVIKAAAGKFLNQKNSIIRPAFGFKYRIILPIESKLLGIPAGALLTKGVGGQPAVLPNSAAHQGGLQEGDVIVSVDGIEIGADISLESVLEKHVPGDSLTFKLIRGQSTLEIKVIAGTLK